jgi:membrane dipeptidase
MDRIKEELEMNRRNFLHCSVLLALSTTLGNFFSFAHASPLSPLSTKGKALLERVQIIDAHAHPDRYVISSRQADTSSSLRAIRELGMVASCFAAVGDSVFLSRGRQPGTEYGSTKTQLEYWIKGPIRQGKLKLVLKASDIPDAVDEKSLPGSILAIEGGDPLEGKPDRLDEFYRLGVRMITIVHYRNNELGDIMRAFENSNPGPGHNGLTEAGRRVVERMQHLGMLVDVAHADAITLKQIVEMSSRPLVDSHTSPCTGEDPSKCGRFRTWNDMERIAKTDGVVCTWPMAYKGSTVNRMTFLDWATEILEMKKRLGMEHVGLGTDGGGGLPKLIEGYRDIKDLVHLAAAMEEVGLSQEDIRAYMGGNFYRILRTCIG